MPKRKTRSAPKKKRSRWRFLLKLTGALLSIPAIIICVFLIRYYFVFNRLIEAKLGQRYEITETEIYASPRSVYPGKPISPQEFLTRLQRLGYVENTSPEAGSLSNYQVEPRNRVRVHNDLTLQEDAGRNVEVRWTGDRIREIVDAGSGQPLDRLALKPELISNLINKDREKRRFVAYRDMPKILVDAVLASEDRRFFSHRGIDPIRILKALWIDIRAGAKVQGASTLTQQFVKNYFLTQERTWRRKLTDAYMSILL